LRTDFSGAEALEAAAPTPKKAANANPAFLIKDLLFVVISIDLLF
jgi:hypothetical protein